MVPGHDSYKLASPFTKQQVVIFGDGTLNEISTRSTSKCLSFRLFITLNLP